MVAIVSARMGSVCVCVKARGCATCGVVHYTSVSVAGCAVVGKIARSLAQMHVQMGVQWWVPMGRARGDLLPCVGVPGLNSECAERQCCTLVHRCERNGSCVLVPWHECANGWFCTGVGVKDGDARVCARGCDNGFGPVLGGHKV